MNDELLKPIGREMLGWPGVSKETHRGGVGQGGFWVPPFTSYKFGRREIGHVHRDTGAADLTFPREIHDELISEGKAKPRGWFPGRRELPHLGTGRRARALELFRMSYECAKAAVDDTNLVGPQITRWGNGSSCPTLSGLESLEETALS